MLAVGGEGVNNPTVVHIRKQLERLFNGCSPLDSNAVRQYLQTPTSENSMMLEAWSRCGRADRGRTISLDLSAAARSTVTPFGIACLICYARAWIDEAEAIALAEAQPVAQKSPVADTPPRRQPQGSTRLPHARESAKRSRKRQR